MAAAPFHTDNLTHNLQAERFYKSHMVDGMMLRRMVRSRRSRSVVCRSLLRICMMNVSDALRYRRALHSDPGSAARGAGKS
jgi:hypothetical protein